MKKHTFLVSDESVNNHGFKVKTDGIDTTQFERNPIMLYMHNRPTIIGRWENLKKKDGKLYADAIFDVDDTFSNEIAGKVDRGFLKGASLGISVLEKDSKTDTIIKSRLHEISIVDIGSNDNALRLYDDKDLIQLNLKELTASSSLLEVLELDVKTTHKDIVSTVLTLKKEHKSFKDQIAKFITLQTKEAKDLIAISIKDRGMPIDLTDVYLSMFAKDFEGTKIAILKHFPVKRVKLADMINNPAGKKLKYDKPKSEWELEDYRKFAPEELASNKDLYQRLIKEEFNN